MERAESPHSACLAMVNTNDFDAGDRWGCNGNSYGVGKASQGQDTNCIKNSVMNQFMQQSVTS